MGIYTQQIKKYCIIDGDLYFVWSYTLYGNGKIKMKVENTKNEGGNVEILEKSIFIICGEYENDYENVLVVKHNNESVELRLKSKYISEIELKDSLLYYDKLKSNYGTLEVFLKSIFGEHIKIKNYEK